MALSTRFPRFLQFLCVLVASVTAGPLWAVRLEMPQLPPAPGYSRLLVTLRSAPQGAAFAGLPAFELTGAQGVRMAYEAALGNNQYIIKLLDNVPLAQAQAISKSIAQDASVLSATVVNEHDKVFYGGVSYTSVAEAPGTPAFELYVPRKGGKNAPLVMAITAAGGSGNLAFLLGGFAEQYGAVLVVMELPADETGQAPAIGPADTQALAQKMAANDAAIAAAASYAGKLTGARTDKFYLYGLAAGGLVAERYVFQHPSQVSQAVFDMAAAAGSPVALARPDPALPYPAGISAATLPGADPAQFLLVPMQVLLPGSTTATDPNSGWAAAMQQFAKSKNIANAAVGSAAVPGSCTPLTPVTPGASCSPGSAHGPTVFSHLLGAAPPNSNPIFLTMGPDTQMALGRTITITGVGAGTDWAVFDGNAWTAGNGGALPAGATVLPGNGRGTSLRFTPKVAGKYSFRLQATDPDKNQVRALINVNVTSPAKSPLPGIGNPSPGSHAFTAAIAGPSTLLPGQSFTLKAVLPAGTDLQRVGCHWRQTSGASARIVRMPKCQIMYVAPRNPGLIGFQLQVTNQKNSVIGSATHLVQVEPKGAAHGKQPAKKGGGPLAGFPGGLSNLPGLPGGLPGVPGVQPAPQKGNPPATQKGTLPVLKGGQPATQAPTSGFGDLFAPSSKRNTGNAQGNEG